MAYIITHNIIDGEDRRERTATELKQFTHFFRLYDDDGELYFTGYSDDSESERAFIPLDAIGASYGCTEIKYRNANTGKMETL